MRSLALLSLILLPTIARATNLPCGAAEVGTIHIDGLLEEWNGVSGIALGGTSRDLSAKLACHYDDKAVYLAFDVRDDYLVRTKEGRAAEDHIELAFSSGERIESLTIYPADEAARAARKVRWSTRRGLTGVSVAEARQPEGWSLEIALPLSSIPGWTPGAPAVRIGIEISDCDSKARPVIEAKVSTSPLGDASALSLLEFAEGKQLLEAFLGDRRLRRSEIAFDAIGRVGPSGLGRAVIAGRWLAILTDEYGYIELPLRDRKDLKEVRLIDLAGDGRDAVVVRYVERGDGPGAGTREIVAVYRMTSDGLRRTFGCEIAKAQGVNRLAARLSFIQRGAATDLLVEAQPAIGWTEATFKERPSDDLVPIPLPWSGEKRARFQFQGDDYLRAE